MDEKRDNASRAREERRKKKEEENRNSFRFRFLVRGCVPSKVSEKCTLAETERGVALAKTSSATKNIIRARRRKPPAREYEGGRREE